MKISALLENVCNLALEDFELFGCNRGATDGTALVLFEPVRDARCVEVVLHIARKGGHFVFFVELFRADYTLVVVGEQRRIEEVFGEVAQHTGCPLLLRLPQLRLLPSRLQTLLNYPRR